MQKIQDNKQLNNKHLKDSSEYRFKFLIVILSLK